MPEIPIIDFAEVFDSGTNETIWEAKAEEIREACHSIGFMYIVNHGIPQETIRAALNESKRFFELPSLDKDEFWIDENNRFRGYSCQGKEILAKGAFELREMFAMLGINSPQKYPEKQVPGFQLAMQDLQNASLPLITNLLKLMGKALKLENENHFLDIHKGLNDHSIPTGLLLRSHYYPPIPKDADLPPNHIRCAPHTDYGVFTVLFQDDIGGLEVRNSNGEWVQAPPIPGSVVVNIGDIIHVASNGYFKATEHRVLIPELEIRKRTQRQSMAFFVFPDDDAMVTPRDTTVALIGPGPFTCKEYYDRRLAVTQRAIQAKATEKGR